MRRIILSVCLTSLVVIPSAARTAVADRQVAWTTASERGLENDINNQALRGLRVAAVSDGLPCTTTVMQAPEKPGPAVRYRVVADRDLAAMMPSLAQDGFQPQFAHRRQFGRAHVIFGRWEGISGAQKWRLIEFKDLDAMPAALTAAAGEGFRAKILVRYPLKSWPGLSETGLILARQEPAGGAVEPQIVIGQSNKIDATAKLVADLTAKGYTFDLLFTGSRDGSRDARRERLVVLLSRAAGSGPASPIAVKLEKTSSFGTFGSGVPLGAAPFWDDSYVYAWQPAERRQTWASPIRLSTNEATTCLGLDFKLRIDAPHDQAWNIVALVAKKLFNNAYELIYVTDQRIGF